MSPQARRRTLGSALLAAAVVLLVWGSAGRVPDLSYLPSGPDRTATSVPEPSAAVATPTVTGHAAAGHPTAAASPAARQARDLTAVTADEYRQRARYPRWSAPLAGAGDPVKDEHEVSLNPFPGPDGEEPWFTIYPEAVVFEPPQVVRLFAFLGTAQQRLPANGVAASITDDRQQTVAELTLNDSGRDGDAHAGDNLYSAIFDPGARREPLKGVYTVGAVANTSAGSPRYAATGFLYSVPDAQLTGRYRDALVDGNLEVAAEIEVARGGRFHLQATLYTVNGQPVAWAQNALPLAPGKQWLALSFYGLVLREAAADGPYVLRYVALATATHMPNMKNRLVENAYVTSAYAASSFSDRPFNDPDLLEAADRLQQR